MGHARGAVSEARAALAASERREAEMGRALHSLQLKVGRMYNIRFRV